MKRLMTAACWVILLAGMTGCESPSNISVGIDAPITVELGEEFTITLTVQNTATEPQKLVDLDIGGQYLEGIAIISTQPDHKEVFKVPLMDITSYTFDQSIPPGQQLTVLMHSKAIKRGDFSADVDFCINSDMNFLTKVIRTIVE